MKPILYLSLLFLLQGFCRAEEAVIPQGYEPGRYEPIWKKSPFTLSSVTEEAAAGGFGEKLALAGILKIGTRDYVSVLNKETKERYFLSAEEGAEGIKVQKIDSTIDWKETVVTLQKGNEVATLRYDQDLLKKSFTEAAPAQPMSMPPPMQVPRNQPPRVGKTLVPKRILLPSQAAPQK